MYGMIYSRNNDPSQGFQALPRRVWGGAVGANDPVLAVTGQTEKDSFPRKRSGNTCQPSPARFIAPCCMLKCPHGPRHENPRLLSETISCQLRNVHRGPPTPCGQNGPRRWKCQVMKLRRHALDSGLWRGWLQCRSALQAGRGRGRTALAFVVLH